MIDRLTIIRRWWLGIRIANSSRLRFQARHTTVLLLLVYLHTYSLACENFPPSVWTPRARALTIAFASFQELWAQHSIKEPLSVSYISQSGNKTFRTMYLSDNFINIKDSRVVRTRKKKKPASFLHRGFNSSMTVYTVLHGYLSTCNKIIDRVFQFHVCFPLFPRFL